MQLYKNFCKETTDENGKLTSFELVFPENYNFGYDVVDKMAELVPNDTAVVWTNPEKEEKIFTYSDISRLSNKAANVFRNHGIKKGDKVLVFHKKRRKGYRKLNGHRQQFTELTIKEVVA